MKIGWMPPTGEDLEPDLPVRYADIARLAQEAESAGLDALWVSDHLLFRSPGEPPSAPWEGWTMLAALAATTSRVELGTLVTATSFRAPGMLAKQAHTVQEISGGRLILGIGAGWHEPEYTAYGFPFDHRGGRFAEAVEIIATLIREGRADFAGQYYTVTDCLLLPPLAAGIGPPPILIAGRGPRMMQLTARWADAWNGAWYGFPSGRFRDERDALYEACAAAGRDTSSIEITAGVLVVEPEGSASGDALQRRLPADPAAIGEALSAWEAEGIGQAIFWIEPPKRPLIERLFEAIARYRS
jgi:alkanesulfonate monooxygenase SsuD/methylene tetrahydromethanopterin reductase-like flavin-dependent oxidoreductase (luciferase family)